jgi:hypothetical protein
MIRIVVMVVAIAAASCGAQSKGLDSATERKDLSQDQVSQHDQLIAQGDAAWEQRGDKAQLQAAISAWEQAVALKPDDAKTYEKLTRALYFLADAFLAFEGDQTAFLAMHEKGYNAAEKGLAALSKDFEDRRLAGTNFEDAIKIVGREGVPLMYWYLSNLGKWGKAQGTTTVLRYKDRIFKTASRVLELDPDYFFGAPDRYFGAYYAVAPSFAGGDKYKSQEHFSKSLAKAPDYLGTHVLIAENLAPKFVDEGGEEMFDKHIEFVLSAPVDIIPELAAEAAAEKRKAEQLKAKKSDLF